MAEMKIYLSEEEIEKIRKAMEKHNLSMKKIMNRDYDYFNEIENFARTVLMVEINKIIN